MKPFLLLLLTIFSFAAIERSATAQYSVKSEFELLLGEKLFDQVIGDFWSMLQGSQTIKLNDLRVQPQGIPVYIQGIRAEVNYEFPLPKRVLGSNVREWDLSTQTLSSKLYVDKVQASGRILRLMDGIRVWIDVNATCTNLVLRLPAGFSEVNARVRAEVVQNQIKLSLPSYQADWKPGSWELESVNCTGIEGFEEVVKEEALKALSSFQNFDAPVKEEIAKRFADWSESASAILLSEQEIPSGKDYLKIFFEPKQARENGNGLLLSGDMRFEYPSVAKGQNIEQVHALNAARSREQGDLQAGNVLLPFAAVKSLLMGEYFAGKLEQTVSSNAIPAFASFMKDRFAQFWAFPELSRYQTNAEFKFQFLPVGPPAFSGERMGGGGTILGNMNLPLAVRMHSFVGGAFTPMVEFRTVAAGPASITLGEGGNLKFSMQAEKQPVTYGWEQSYLKNYKPDQRVSVDVIADKVRSSLSTQAFNVAFPALQVGSLSLKPASWLLENGNLRLNFAGQVAAAVKAKAVKAARR
ncbi:MAG: hypothetical protein EOP11_04760 [Proteobacteria bacterium]|nr:MAG: hypothetical protein EOP11_04760 [Pseudomonadota bacterium]